MNNQNPTPENEKVLNRIFSPLNKFWKKVRNGSLIIASVSGAIAVAIPVTAPIAGVIAIIAGSIAGTSQLTKK